jgi:tartrate dehydratase alpha subunit/fumarate hydratase class I-like protein
MTIKINIKDEDSQNNIDDLLDTYIKYLDEDFIEVLKKLKETKPDTITKKEKDMIIENYNYYEGLYNSIGNLLENMLNY